MNTEAYRTLMARLRDLDGSVFTPTEAQLVREAADARLFGDEDQDEAVARALDLFGRLVEAARLSKRTSSMLSDMLCEIESVGA